MVDFVKHRDLKWAYENIEAVMPTFNTHGVWIFEPDFDLVYSVNAPGLGSLKGLPFSKKELREIFAQSHFRHFFMCHDSLLCEFRTAPIQPSDDLDRVTPPRGYFLASRCWTKEALTELSFMTGSQIRLDFLAGDTLNAEPESQNKYIVALYRTLSGWDDQPVARLVSVSEQNFLKDFAGYYRVQFYFLIIFVTLIMVIISIFLNHYLDRPIRTISASLEHNDPTLLEKIKSQSTEFGSIAQLINHFFMQKEKLIKEYEERIKAEQRSQNIIDNAPIGISFFRLRADGHLIFMGANPAADKILARNHLDYVGMTLDEVFPVLLETELPDAFRKVVMTGGHYHSAEVGWCPPLIVRFSM
jgi:PAS domain-containing protein